MVGIAICHHKNNIEFLKDLVDSISGIPYKIYEDGIDRIKDSYEIGAINEARKDFDNFILLQDTCLIKDTDKLIEILNKSGNIAFSDNFFHYIGKYQTDLLPQLPENKSKDDSITNEAFWSKIIGNFSYIENPLKITTNVFEDRHGRKNMVLENDFIIKYKNRYE